MINSILSAVLSAEEYAGNLLKSLEIFWKGLLAIFIVICLIIGATYALKRTIERLEARKAAEADAEAEAEAEAADAEER
ncbi:MAG: hypothetical protein LBQ40_05445 [Clostridiales bacterium]|nr:hypothetical protein [Clostridiales bacterium]